MFQNNSGVNKYYEAETATQVIGALYKNPCLLDREGEYYFCEEDFVNEFHKVLFGAIYGLVLGGATRISKIDISNYLKDKPQSLAVYESSNGPERLESYANSVIEGSFDYYYKRLKKFSLLRGYQSIGMDVSFIYNSDQLDIKPEVKAKQAEEFDRLTLEEIADKIETKIEDIKRERIDNSTNEAVGIGNGIFELLDSLQEEPEMGYPMYGRYINTITRGARLGKLFLRSAATGVGEN